MSQLARAYGLTSVDDTRDLYDKWASSYDLEMAKEGQDYVGPALAVAYLLKSLGVPQIDPNMEVMDAGCGTGLVGVHMAKVGSKKLDGVDLSPGMLEIARSTGAYRSLDTADLSTRLIHKDNTYDATLCVGTLTQAHVGPIALDEFVRITKPQGIVIATILGSIYQSGGYEAKIEDLVNQGKAQLVSAELEDYRRSEGIQARMVVIKVLS